MGRWRHILTALLDLVLPRECLVCGDRLDPGERFLCIRCRADFPRTRFSQREHNPMADRFNARIADHASARPEEDGRLERETADHRPEEAGQGYERYARAAALFFYRAGARFRRIPQVLKYEGDLAAGGYFGALLGEELARSPLFADVDAVVPVPLHWMRRYRRGYNQAKVLARAVVAAYARVRRNAISERDPEAKRPPPTLESRWIVRRRRTRTQTKLRVEEKLANVRSAFAPSRRLLKMCRGTAKDAAALHILLLDDVFTTGATLSACHAALRQCFPPRVRISVATLGFVEGD